MKSELFKEIVIDHEKTYSTTINPQKDTYNTLYTKYIDSVARVFRQARPKCLFCRLYI